MRRQALADQVPAQQGGNAQAERQLDDLDRFPAKVPALIERPQSERGVHGKRRVEQQRSERALPPRHVEPEPVFHGVERNVAQGVIDEMTEQIREQHEAAGEAHLPHADAAQELARAEAGLGVDQALFPR